MKQYITACLSISLLALSPTAQAKGSGWAIGLGSGIAGFAVGQAMASRPRERVIVQEVPQQVVVRETRYEDTTASSRLRRLQEENGYLQEDVRNLTRTNTTLERENNRLRTHVTTIEQELYTTQGKLRAAQNENDGLRRNNTQLQENITQKQKEVTTLQQRVAELEQKIPSQQSISKEIGM